MIHKIAIGAIALGAKGILIAGHALGHALAAHSAEAALAKTAAVHTAHAAAAHPVAATLLGLGVVGVPIVTVAYLDKAEMERQLLAAADGVSSAHSVKIAVGGNLFNGEFTAVSGPFRQDTDHVMVASYDEDTQTLSKKILIKATKVESKIAEALSGGNVVVLA